MQLKEIVSPTVKELFVKEIEGMILSGRVAIGAQLPAEREMAAQMKISRTTVNAGLAELEAKGFIEVVPRKGNYVADYKRHGNLETLLAIINFNGGGFEYEVWQSMMEFRRNIECEGAFLAAQNRTREDIDRLAAICDELESAPKLDRLPQLIFDFHHSILCATQNYIYPLVFNAFKDICLICSNTVFLAAGVVDASKHTREILSAIEAQDAPHARDTMYKLITERMNQLSCSRPCFGKSRFQ